MTPEEARELLEAATPGPWRAFMATSGQVIVDSGEIDNAGDAPLAAAAPALAELVANLHYEYAVQVLDEQWRTLCDAWTSEEAARSRYDATPGKHTGRVRIVRRLVSDPEVVE